MKNSKRADKYGPGSPYDCATRAARDLPPGPEKAAAFEGAAMTCIEGMRNGVKYRRDRDTEIHDEAVYKEQV